MGDKKTTVEELGIPGQGKHGEMETQKTYRSTGGALTLRRGDSL